MHSTRQDHIRHHQVLHAEAEIGRPFIQFIVDALAQHIAGRADDVVVKGAVTDTYLHRLARLVLHPVAGQVILQIDAPVLGPQRLDRVRLADVRAEYIAADHQADPLLVLGDDLLVLDVERDRLAGDAYKLNKEADVRIDTRANHVLDPPSLELNTHLLFVYALERVEEVAGKEHQKEDNHDDYDQHDEW